MCRFFEVSRSGYYDYVKRLGRPAFDQALAEKIGQCQSRVGKTYGYRRVHIWLKKQGITSGSQNVSACYAKNMDYFPIFGRRKYRQMSEYLH
jgi:hypothetical protein